jgi:hypothetical protein
MNEYEEAEAASTTTTTTTTTTRHGLKCHAGEKLAI